MLLSKQAYVHVHCLDPTPQPNPPARGTRMLHWPGGRQPYDTCRNLSNAFLDFCQCLLGCVYACSSKCAFVLYYTMWPKFCMYAFELLRARGLSKMKPYNAGGLE